MLKKIGQAMSTDLENSYMERYDKWRELSWGSMIWYRPNWATMVAFEKAVSEIARAVSWEAGEARGDYSSIASMVVASSINYDRAEGIIEANRPRLEKAINGARHELYETPRPASEPEDVSTYSALEIKDFFDNQDLEKLTQQERLFHQVATEMTVLQDMCQQRAHGLSISWKSSAAEHALEAMRKLCATFRTLAYTAGATGSALATLHQVLKNYKTNFESIVNIDQTVGEWFSDLFWDMDEHDRARNLLLDANVRVVEAHNLLPSKLETVLPHVVPVASTLAIIEGGDDLFWKSWELLMQNR